MHYQVGNACYDTAQQAAQAASTASLGAVHSLGSTAYAVDVAAVSDTSITYTLYPFGGGVPITEQIPFTAQPCNLLTAPDALTLGWGIVGAWVATYAIIFIARTFRGETGGDYGRDA